MSITWADEFPAKGCTVIASSACVPLTCRGWVAIGECPLGTWHTCYLRAHYTNPVSASLQWSEGIILYIYDAHFQGTNACVCHLLPWPSIMMMKKRWCCSMVMMATIPLKKLGHNWKYKKKPSGTFLNNISLRRQHTPIGQCSTWNVTTLPKQNDRAELISHLKIIKIRNAWLSQNLGIKC